MANPGEWIDFATLCSRVPGKSARTLRRYLKARLISYRQAGRGCRMEFNWRTVARELAALETHGVNANAAAAISEPPDLVHEIAELRTLISAIAARMGVDEATLFAGEHHEERKAG